MLGHFGRHEKLGILRPAVELFGQLHLVRAERRPVGAVRIGLIRRTPADDAFEDDDRRLVGYFAGRVDRPLDRLGVVGVIDLNRIPAVTFEPRSHIFAESQLGMAFDRDRVVVVNPEQVVELEVAGS
jgi:hypothetical protein